MSLPDIPDEILERKIADSVSDVCVKLMGGPCVFESAEELSGALNARLIPSDGGAESLFVGSVGFVGAINGVVYLFFNPSLAGRIAGAILGKDALEDDSEQALDACGELANMVGGGLKNALAALGHESTLTVPTMMSGDELCLSTKGVKRYLRSRFSLLGQELIVDVALTEFV